VGFEPGPEPLLAALSDPRPLGGELEAFRLVAPGVAERLDPERSYGVSWASRQDWKVLGRERLPDGRYRDQQAEDLITMAKLREKLDGTRTEREDLEARLAVLADGESRLRELAELPLLVEGYLKDLPYLVDRMPVIREYETVGTERTPENPLGIYALTPERIRSLPEEEVAMRSKAAEAARGARFRELYAMLGLRAAIHADGTLEITVGATGEATKGVMPCDEPG
jgi:hypothetical protein